MPTVPRYEQRVGQAALPNARVSTNAPIEAFGGGQGLQQVAQAAQETLEIVRKEREKADQLAVLEADTKAARLKTSLFFDPKTGAMTRKGKDAFGAVSTKKT
jgi:hypothetical protein